MSRRSQIEIEFDNINSQLKREITGEALKWYLKNAKKLNLYSKDINPTISEKDFLQRHPIRRKVYPGMMYAYKYDPKLKDSLPYYDEFPLIILLEIYDNGFLGFNTHYINPKARAMLIGKIQETMKNDMLSEKARTIYSYNMLKAASKIDFFKAGVKRYLYSQLKSPLRGLDVWEQKLAIYLPLEKFKGATKQHVWRVSKK